MSTGFVERESFQVVHFRNTISNPDGLFKAISTTTPMPPGENSRKVVCWDQIGLWSRNGLQWVIADVVHRMCIKAPREYSGMLFKGMWL